MNVFLNQIAELSNKPSILVAEDEPDNYFYLEVILKNLVSRIGHAVNGQEAIEMASNYQYDLILMDMRMPVMSGIEATQAIKRRFPKTPIIGQTACASHEERETAISAGCDDLIVKPIRRRELMEIINRFIAV